MIGRIPRHRSLADDVDPLGLHVFIPGALAGGVLVSVGLLLGDAVRSLRGQPTGRRRVTVTAAALAEEVRLGSGAATSSAAGLRSRGTYAIVGSIALAIVVSVVPGSAWNFLAPDGYLAHIAWIWSLSTLLVAAMAVVAVQVLRLAPEWVPIAAALIGAGVGVRFSLGSEAGTVQLAVLAVTAVVTPAIVAATWRLRRRRGVVHVPPSVRPLLTNTPLGTDCRAPSVTPAGQPA